MKRGRELSPDLLDQWSAAMAHFLHHFATCDLSDVSPKDLSRALADIAGVRPHLPPREVAASDDDTAQSPLLLRESPAEWNARHAGYSGE